MVSLCHLHLHPSCMLWRLRPDEFVPCTSRLMLAQETCWGRILSPVLDERRKEYERIFMDDHLSMSFLLYYSVFECFRCLWYVLFRRSYVECPSLAFDEYRTKVDPPSELLSEPVASHVEVLRLPRSPSALMPQMSTQIMR